MPNPSTDRPKNRAVEYEDEKPASDDGATRTKTEPAGSEGSAISPKTRTDPASGEPTGGTPDVP